MGWTFNYGATKQDVVREWTREQGWGKDPVTNEERVGVALKHCVRGNVMWTVHEIKGRETGSNPVRFIGCFLLGTDGQGNWGYKDMEESMGPSYYSCPPSYLDMVPCPNGPYAKDWRELVRQYWANRKPKVKLQNGLRMKMVGGNWKWRGFDLIGTEFTLVRNGRRWLASIDGSMVRFPRKMLADAEVVA